MGVALTAFVVLGVAAVRLTFELFLDLVVVHGSSCAPNLIEGDLIIARKVNGSMRSVGRADLVLITSDGSNIIKRIIGLPGEHLLIKGGRVFVNESPLDEPYLDPTVQWTRLTDWPIGPQRDLQIPLSGFFVMGDNRDASADSRTMGLIAPGELAARAWFRIWPISRVSGFGRALRYVQ
ncbi:MAG: signal peptidase I [Candidatus Dormibacteraceae bacterium]